MKSGFKIGGITAASGLTALLITSGLGIAGLRPDSAYAATTEGAAPATSTKEEPGLTLETAIAMPAYKTSLEGIAAERAYFTKAYPGWKKSQQALIDKDGRYYDLITIEGPGGATKDLYFDITDWFGAPLFPPE